MHDRTITNLTNTWISSRYEEESYLIRSSTGKGSIHYFGGFKFEGNQRCFTNDKRYQEEEFILTTGYRNYWWCCISFKSFCNHQKNAKEKIL